MFGDLMLKFSFKIIKKEYNITKEAKPGLHSSSYSATNEPCQNILCTLDFQILTKNVSTRLNYQANSWKFYSISQKKSKRHKFSYQGSRP